MRLSDPDATSLPATALAAVVSCPPPKSVIDNPLPGCRTSAMTVARKASFWLLRSNAQLSSLPSQQRSVHSSSE